MSVAVTRFGSTPVLKLLVGQRRRTEDRLMSLRRRKAISKQSSTCSVSACSPGGANSATRSRRCPDAAKLCAVACGKRRSRQRRPRERGRRAERHGQESDARALSVSARSRRVARVQGPGGIYSADAGRALDGTAPARDRMVEVAALKGVDPNARNDRGETAYQLAARVGIASTLDLLVKAGAKEVKEEWPRPAGGAPSARGGGEKDPPADRNERRARIQEPGAACPVTTIRFPQ